MTTIMATVRRLILRKKRCIFILVAGCLICAITSWFFTYQAYKDMRDGSSLVHMPHQLTARPIEPKFNVLEPPKSDGKITSSENHHTSRTQIATIKTTVSIRALLEKSPLSIHNSTLSSQKNVTEDIEVKKNKTLSQIGLLGHKENEKNITKIVFHKMKWNLSVSFEDIGNLMKDTAFLNKLKPLNLSGPMLTSSRNRTSNFSLSMPIKMGYCDCWERYCFCCVQLVNEKLHLNNKTCTNFTFSSKSHELDISFRIDNKTVYKGSISADAPPLLCIGSVPSVADICIHFFNMLYRVDRLMLHKSQILGCMGVSLNIYNKTVSIFPMDCFQIPGDPNHHHAKENIILPNFVP
ncbi:hypothetical protein Bpfe_026424 [Biomphalaria pfeifferi]|uniref:DUF4773 domain-containing protein n=1 Tax=Biomphalaria pfeifferi TaxID=112525 RepID=A0AAD8AXH1_BIOPF|nr:hypothetical protein Bpfe_026424 [Biomphalaria pfeifferi]